MATVTYHSLLFPYCVIAFGLNKSLLMRAEFTCEDLGDGLRVEVTELIGKDDLARKYNYLMLIKDGDGEGIDKVIMNGILGNTENWDNPKPWW